MAFSELTNDVIDVAKLQQHVRDKGFGAYVTFLGDVRNHDSGRSVTGIVYHAYDDMARAELSRLTSDAEQRWPGVACVVSHRIGRLTIGETSVAIIVGSAHRAEAFDACRWLIDTIKTSVPIWKREEYADGEAVWIEGSHQFPAAEVAR